MLHDLFKGFENQAAVSGFPALTQMRLFLMAAPFLLILMILGSCNESGTRSFQQLTDITEDMGERGRGELVRVAYDLQSAVAENPDMLLRMNARELQFMLAAPDLDRRDFPSIAWQYRSQSCVLDVFYTAPGEDALQEAQVQYYEIRSRDLITAETNEDVAAWSCMQSLYQERRDVIEASFEQNFAFADDAS